MKPIILLFCVAALAMAQPQIAANGIVNAASNAYVGMPNSSIAQGSIFTIYGVNLGPASSPAPSFPLQTSLGGVSIQVTSGSTTVNAIPIFVGSKQVNAILPASTPTGAATLTATYSGQTSAAASFQVIASSFGIFTFNSVASGSGIITDANNRLFNVNSPAHPNDAATIWGTGLGASPGDDGSTPPQQIDMPNLPLSVYVGTQKATVTYRGRSVFTGEDQINFVVPSEITDCYVPIAVQIGNIVSNFVTMPIAPSGQPCPDPLMGFLSSRPLEFGSIALTRSTTIGATTSTTDSGQAYFGPAMLPGLPFPPLPSGTCTVALEIPSGAVSIPNTLDAGPAITVAGPLGSKQLTPLVGFYSAQLGGGSGTAAQPLYLDAGAYTASGQGGADVGPFSQNFTIPPPLTWTNQSGIAIVDRSTSLDVTWTGGDPNSTVQISGDGETFICNAKVSDQHFTIPTFVLLSLPPSSGRFVDLQLSTNSTTPFTASGITSGTINSTVTIQKNVTYQ